MLIDEELNIVAQEETLIDPQVPIPPEVSKIHGIYDEDVRKAPTLQEYKEHILKDRLAGPVTLIAHQASFDAPFFREILDVQNVYCTLALARYLWPMASNHKLQTLRDHFGIKVEAEAHSAMGDLVVLRELLIRGLREEGMTLAESCAQPPRTLKVMPFGAHKGKPMDQVPRGYREWLAKLPDTHVDTRYTLEQLRLQHI
jgi:DNA polymerase III epsilon subunit-like protein